MGKRKTIDCSGNVAYGFAVAEASLGRNRRNRIKTGLGKSLPLMVWRGKGNKGSLSP